MSMNFSEFKKLALADPWNQDPEVLEARQSTPEIDQAFIEAQALDQKIQAAVKIAAPADLVDSIKVIARPPVRQHRWMPWALAASILIAISAIGVVWKQSQQWSSVEEYLVDHYSRDGQMVLAEAGETVPGTEVSKIMASMNASASQQLADTVKFIKYCPTPNGQGAHMVVSTSDGPMTIIFMPNTYVAGGEMVEFGQEHAFVVDLQHGSAAIIGSKEQPVQSLQSLIRSAIVPLQNEV